MLIYKIAIEWTQCSSSLTLNGKSCETSCDRGSYISTATSEDMGVLDVNTCTQWNAPWYEWISNTECLSCAKGNFLEYTASGGVVGTWTTITGSTATYNLFVKASYEETNGDGSYANPFGNIVKAISYAQDQAADQDETTVNICMLIIIIYIDLLKGDHFMTRNFKHYNYDKTKESKYSYNMNIAIQPVFWGKILGDHTFGAADSDWIQISDQITVYYQMGNSYSFIVPKSLYVKSIVFDALDSSLLPSEKCLQYNSRWCTINDGQMSINSSNPSAPATWSVQTIQTEECKFTFGASFFQFGYSDNLSNINGVGTLNIDQCYFKNFFYDFTSLIGLINGHGKVQITGSTFDSFSNWGSIIRDTRELPLLDYTKSQGITTLSYRDSMNSINILQNKYYAKPTVCVSTLCASIKIDTSTFTNFSFMKSGGKTYHQVSSTSKMMFQGIILNLRNFYGDIVVKNSTFTGLKFKYNNWEEVYNSGTTYDSDNIWGSPTILQAKTLIYVSLNSGQLEIYNNTFKNCNSLMGLIYLHRSSSFNSPILIHQNTFTQNSAIQGANVINIYLWTKSDYKTLFTSQSMIWAGVQISSNTFTQNVGWFNTIGTIQAVWYSDSSDVPLSQKNQYSDPKSMSKNKSENLSKSGIVSFTTINNTIMSSSLIQIDLNKFLLKKNTYNENFAGAQASIIKLTNIRRIHIDSDTYINNWGQYLESLNKYGSIMSTGDTSNEDKLPGAYSLFAYYGSSGTNLTINEIIYSESQQNYYPAGFLVIDGSLYVSTTGLIFDNNAMQELTQSLVTNQYPSNAITFRRSQGNIYLNSLTIQNYVGLDMNKLSSILGTNYAYVKTASPTERNVQGSPNTLASSPNYYIDYSFKNCLIRLVVPSTITNTDFQNNFDVFNIDKLTIKNITQYSPSTSIALFSQFSDDWADLILSNFDIQNVDMIQTKTSMFVIQNYGTLTIINGAISNINKNAYSLSTSDYSYVGSNGAIFTLNSVQQSSDYSSFTSSISNVTFDTIYSREGGAFYFGSSSSIQNAQPNTINMNSINVQNSFAYSNGLLSFISGSQYATITSSKFLSNTGVKGEANLYVKQFGSLEISSSIFNSFQFLDSSRSTGQSITISMTTPTTLSFKLTSVIFKWSSTEFDAAIYKTSLSDSVTLTKASPIKFSSGVLITTNCTFSNWFSSQYGGVMFVDADTIYTDIGSTFTQNAAKIGGAIYLSQATVALTNTIFVYNYANYGGAINAESSSKIQTFNGVNCNYNYVSSSGGWLYWKGESNAVIYNSKFSYNYADETSSVIYFLGANPSSISNSEFTNNISKIGYTIALLFADMDFTNITMKDNIANSDTSGVFINFWKVTINNSQFNITLFPNGASNSSDASSSSNLLGGFISVSSGANVVISSTKFQNGYANNGGAIYISGNSIATLNNWSFISWASGSYGGAIYASGFSSLVVSNCNFRNNNCKIQGWDLYLNYGKTILISEVKFLVNLYQSVYIYGGYITVFQISITNTDSSSKIKDSKIYGTGIYATNMNSFSLASSNFTNINYGGNGGAIYLSDTTKTRKSIPDSASCTISSCYFVGNSGYNGGAIFIENIDYAIIQTSTFINNTVTINNEIQAGGYGGAIYYFSSGKIFL